MEIEHPASWELSSASAFDEPGRCAFSDRLYQRLDVRWRPLKYVPNLEIMLKKHRRKESRDDEVKLSDLTGAPEPWRGVVRQGQQATIVNAGAFFRDSRLLVEAAIVWPEQRDRELEDAMLAAIHPQEGDCELRRWQAMGISMSVRKDRQLREAILQVGKISWMFQNDPRRDKATLTVQRLAMPDAWLNTSLLDWLATSVPDGHKVVRQDPVTVNSHRGHQIISRRSLGLLSAIRGRHEMLLSMAWLCPTENRVYRVEVAETSRQEEIALPEDLSVTCCRRAPGDDEERRQR